MRDEMYIPVKKVRFSLREPTEEPKTWEEWLIHISAFCVECRKTEIPEKVWNDYLKLKGD
jgi:hypothetical protein